MNEQKSERAAGTSAPACSASDITECVGCKRTLPAMRLYYVGGAGENEPLCAPCVVDALLALRTKAQNDKLTGQQKPEKG